MKRIIVLVFWLLVLCQIQNSNASSFVAGDLTYTCLGGNSYQVTAALYYDCAGNPPATSIPISVKCSSDSSLNFQFTLFLLSGSGQEVTPGCGITPTTCNGGTRFGVREYVYSGQSVLVPCENWILSYSDCCRNQVNTIFNSVNSGFRVKAMLNNIDAPCNSAPSFSDKPIPIICKSQHICFNQGALDPNGDSLVFSLVSPESDNENQYLNYYPPYSFSNFLLSNQPITIDGLTGDICMWPSTLINTNTAVKIEEYRKVDGINKLVGIVYRDIQFRTMSCDNFIPILSGMDFNQTHQFNINDTIYNYKSMVGENISFDINTYDSDTFNPNVSGQYPKLFIGWNNGIPQANFSRIYNGTDSAYAHFQWIPTINDVSFEPHCFNVFVSDNACPYSGSNTFTYCIKVDANTSISDKNSNPFYCSISPNPTNGYLRILFSEEINEEINFQIINVNGQILLDGVLPIIAPENGFTLDLNGYEKGLYFIEFSTINANWSTKFILQ